MDTRSDEEGLLGAPKGAPVVSLTLNQVPECIQHLHRLAETGYAKSYLKTQTGGMIVLCEVAPIDSGDFPELGGVDKVWLCYSGYRHRQNVVVL